jgi:hypothetical protein
LNFDSNQYGLFKIDSDYVSYYDSAFESFLQGPITITQGDTLSCYYEYFAQELYAIKYEIPDLAISSIIQTNGNLKFSKNNIN